MRAEAVQPFCTLVSIVKFSSSGSRALTKMKENGKTLLKVDYTCFSTHPPAVDVSRERYITFFPIPLTVLSFLQQIKVLS